MGFFSWACCATDESVPGELGAKITVVLPNDSRVWGIYDGYGRVLAPVAYDPNGKECAIEDLGIVLYEGGFDIHCAYGSFVIKDFQSRDDAFKSENFDVIEGSVKILLSQKEPRFDAYKDLDVSKSCPYQGFFYPFDDPEVMDEIGDDDIQERGVYANYAYRLYTAATR